MADEATLAEHEDKDGKPDTKPMVPLERLNAVLAKVRMLEAKVNQPAPEAKPEKVWSRAELADAVAKGVITQEQADEYSDNQLLKRAKAEATAEVTGLARQEAAQRELQSYQDAYPDLLDETGERFKLVAAEYQGLLALGSPANSATMVAATKAALGPLKLAGKIGIKPRRSIPEGGSGGHGADEEKASKIPAKHLAYYEKQVAQGRIKSMKEAEAQWERYQARGAAA